MIFRKIHGIVINPIKRSFFITAVRCREVADRKGMLKSLPPVDEGTSGENSWNLDVTQPEIELFPTRHTMKKLFDGVPFANLPIINIRVSPNNSIFTLSDEHGKIRLTKSCGMEGYKNARKGTNIAAQQTAITFGTNTLERGVKTVRVRLRGLGPGRMSGIKGLQMAGLNIVSVTDNTRVSWTPPRPKKQRKL